ncbi:patched domain-containing protein 3-like [Battus philenor]|uniref:patched domain-containing protein 3-like n=1 Tax=Battus philenor TaxID=42288 RepID=UPI0035CF909F
MPTQQCCGSLQQLWEDVASIFVNFVERIFFVLGANIAKHPWRTISLVWTFVFISCFGLMRFHIEKNPIKLWVPPESDFFIDTNWYIDQFGTTFRFQKILLTADNVLEPEVFKEINNIVKEIDSLTITYKSENYTLQDFCYQVPIVNFLNTKENNAPETRGNASQIKSNKKKSNSEFSDSTLWVDDEFYCGFLNKFSFTCLQYNILDLWGSDKELINNVTKEDIIKKINHVQTNPISGHEMGYTKLLGGVKYNSTGYIVSAKALLFVWYTQVNMSDTQMSETGNLVGTEDWQSVQLSMWEKQFLMTMKKISSNITNAKLYYEAGRSFADVSGETMFNDMDKLFIGIVLMFIYALIALSRCNWLEVKITLGSVGLLCVGMAYVTAVSWCSVFGVPFGPVHSSLPFLLMGLGIDDMFVMDACWRMVSNSKSTKSTPTKVGLMLKHAGVSIVITSFTDIVALLIGAITILPSLKSFCIYGAAGVFFVFCYSVTFYVAVFSLDLRRIEQSRNGVLFCYTHKKPVPLSEENTKFHQLLSQFYKRIIFTKAGKTIVILFTIIMTCFSIQATLKLEQRFDPKWFIPESSYYKKFISNYEYYYPDNGQEAMVFMGKMDYNYEFSNVIDMIDNLSNNSYVMDMVTWTEYFHRYVLVNYNRDLRNHNVTNTEFNKYLSRFLFSPIGGKFQASFKFQKPLVCGEPVSNIQASLMSFKLKNFQGPEQYIPAMNHIKNVVKSANISTGDGYRSVWSKVFANWVTDEVIGVEVERNIELALLCVMACTIVLITNLQMCLWIFVCVLLTIINVLGWMQRWGMTVDIVCCIGLELAIGLCVDYAAHVGHTFLTITNGSRNDRAFDTVTSIGSAVLLGGGSTLLSLSLLGTSEAYTFQSFFKIFLLVILFGLFNGLVFLPVTLSLIGPDAYRVKDEKNTSPEAVELKEKPNDKDSNSLGS